MFWIALITLVYVRPDVPVDHFPLCYRVLTSSLQQLRDSVKSTKEYKIVGDHAKALFHKSMQALPTVAGNVLQKTASFLSQVDTNIPAGTTGETPPTVPPVITIMQEQQDVPPLDVPSATRRRTRRELY